LGTDGLGLWFILVKWMVRTRRRLSASSTFPADRRRRRPLARLVDADGGRDDAENSYYEAFADPDFVRVETTQRRFRGQYLRRLRRLAARHDHRHLTD
jgi:hypothetical protein